MRRTQLCRWWLIVCSTLLWPRLATADPATAPTAGESDSSASEADRLQPRFRASEPLSQAPSRRRPARPGGPRVEPRVANRVSNLRDPQGSLLVGITGGATFASGVQFGTVGVHVGYAVLTGVVPGIRGNVFFGGLSGGQVVGTLWLTPPINLVVVPFGVAEAGYVWQNINDQPSNGAVYGVGGGVHLGRPTDRLAVRAGVIYRYFNIDGGEGYISPIIIGSLRF